LIEHYSIDLLMRFIPATVQCMTIDKERHLLFSGSHDMSIIVWNIKSASFSAFELHGHL